MAKFYAVMIWVLCATMLAITVYADLFPNQAMTIFKWDYSQPKQAGREAH